MLATNDRNNALTLKHAKGHKMSLISAMPGPSGENGNKMFILKGRPNSDPRFAYDAKNGVGADPFDGLEDNSPKTISAWASENMSAQDIVVLIEELQKLTAGGPSTAEDASSASSFYARFPDAKNIKNLGAR